MKETGPLPHVRSLAAVGGIAAGPVFAALVAVATVLQLDFLKELGWSMVEHGTSAWPSSLAQGPHAWIQIVAYAVTGWLLLAFAASAASALPRGASRTVATVFLTWLALAFVLLAFPEDGPPFGDPTTPAGYVHGVGVLSLAVTTFAAPLSFARAVRGTPIPPKVRRDSFVAAALLFVFFFGLIFVLEVATTFALYAFFVTLFAWTARAGLALRALALASTATAIAAPPARRAEPE